MIDKYADLADKKEYAFGDLVNVLEALLAPGGCPWDREQTHDSLKRYMIEEAYETLEAIDLKDDALLCEELGDVLLQVVFHANIAKSFTIDDVVAGVCKKMISRHPHVFGSVVANTAGEVLTNWEKIKREEKGLTDEASSLKRVPANLPALMRAYKVQGKAGDAGFKFKYEQNGDADAPTRDIEDEVAELREAIASGDHASVEGVLGDLLFAAVGLSRRLKVHPELALTASTERFIRRFEEMEKLMARDGRTPTDTPPSAMDEYWKKAKGLSGE